MIHLLLGHKLRAQSQGISYSLPKDGTEESFFYSSFSIFYCLYIQQIVKSSISDNSAVPITQLHFFNGNTPFYAPSDTTICSVETMMRLRKQPSCTL